MPDQDQSQEAVDRQPDPGEGAGDNPTTFEPTTPQVNRARAQGLGVGQKEIDYQRDPTRARSADRYGTEAPPPNPGQSR